MEEKVANHKSALKRHRQSLKRAARNKAVRTRIKNSVKKYQSVLATKEEAQIVSSLSATTSTLDKAAKKGVIHWKKAARRVSRLANAAKTAAT